MKLLIYSFEKCGILKENPAYKTGQKIHEMFNSENVILIQLPVTYDCWEILKNGIDKFKPDYIMGIGVMIGLNNIHIEKMALNYMHANTPDNKGIKHTMKKIDKNKQLAYETNIDILKLVQNLNSQNIPAEISFNPNTYICNYTYYNCLSYLENTDTKTLFIHIPVSPEEAINSNLNIPIFSTDITAKGLYEMLKQEIQNR